MIEIQDLTKVYGHKIAVDHLTVTVRPGVVTGFLGPNGAGRSTTMRMILGLDHPIGGQVRISGHRYTAHRAPLREVGALLEVNLVVEEEPGRFAMHDLIRRYAQGSAAPMGDIRDGLPGAAWKDATAELPRHVDQHSASFCHQQRATVATATGRCLVVCQDVAHIRSTVMVRWPGR